MIPLIPVIGIKTVLRNLRIISSPKVINELGEQLNYNLCYAKHFPSMCRLYCEKILIANSSRL